MFWILSRSFLSQHLSLTLVEVNFFSRTFVAHHVFLCVFLSGLPILSVDEMVCVLWFGLYISVFELFSQLKIALPFSREQLSGLNSVFSFLTLNVDY